MNVVTCDLEALCYDPLQKMKKPDRIGTMLGDLELGESDYHGCDRAYIQLVTAGRKLDPSRKAMPLKP